MVEKFWVRSIQCIDCLLEMQQLVYFVQVRVIKSIIVTFHFVIGIVFVVVVVYSCLLDLRLHILDFLIVVTFTSVIVITISSNHHALGQVFFVLLYSFLPLVEYLDCKGTDFFE